MIRRLLFLALAVLAAAWWSRRVFAALRASQGGSAGASGRSQVKNLGPMVRDRVCNTFLPKSRAVSLSVDSEEHFFCSEECRNEFQARRSVPTA